MFIDYKLLPTPMIDTSDNIRPKHGEYGRYTHNERFHYYLSQSGYLGAALCGFKSNAKPGASFEGVSSNNQRRQICIKCRSLLAME